MTPCSQFLHQFVSIAIACWVKDRKGQVDALLSGVQNMEALSSQNILYWSDRFPSQRDSVSHTIHILSLGTKVDLHVNDNDASVDGVEIAIGWPFVGLRVTVDCRSLS